VLRQLSCRSGVGSAKLDRYADPVLAVLGVADPGTVSLVEVG
jgi:hypothetical protein